MREVFGERALVVRPGLIVGPHDPTGRFTYWPHRVARGGEVLAPGTARAPDAGDRRARSRRRGSSTLCERETAAPSTPRTRDSHARSCSRRVARSPASDAPVTWVTDEFLLEHEVGEWMELPLWLADPAFAAADRRRRGPRARGGARVPAARGHGPRHSRRSAETADGVGLDRPNARPSCSQRGMAASKDYSGTPLSQKLGAKPGAGVVVFFTTTRDELEQRFDALKATLDPADGLWIAWPKKAAKIEGDLTFEAVQEIGLAHGLVDNKSLLDRRALAGAPLRLPAHGSAMKSYDLRARSHGSSSQRIRSGSIAARVREIDSQALEADDVDDRVRRRHERAPRIRARRARASRRARAPRRVPRPSSTKQRTEASIAARCPCRSCSVWCASAATCTPSRSLSAASSTVAVSPPAPATRIARARTPRAGRRRARASTASASPLTSSPRSARPAAIAHV